jgi:hypothetical protein
MNDVHLSSQFLELSSALRRRATFVQRSDYKAQISYVADVLDRSAANSQPTTTPYQPTVPVGRNINVVV